jgi:Tfp pilus assembly protein FimV
MPKPCRQIPQSVSLYGTAVQGLWALLLVGVCGCALTATSRASQSATAPEQSIPVPAASAPRSYQPKPNETLDQVIGHTLPGSPLKIELLRQAFQAQNPQAFVPGKVPMLRKGVALTVPDHDELLRVHLGAHTATVPEPAQPSRFIPSTPEERKRWVQFP